MVELRRRAKFGRNPSNRGRDYGDSSIFQDGGRRHLGFFKFETFKGRTALPNLVEIRQTVAEI